MCKIFVITALSFSFHHYIGEYVAYYHEVQSQSQNQPTNQSKRLVATISSIAVLPLLQGHIMLWVNH